MPRTRTALRPTGIRLLATAALAVGALTAALAPTATPGAAADPISDVVGSFDSFGSSGSASTGSSLPALSSLPVPHGAHTAIVILGYGLLPDGSMRPELISRLRAGLVQSMVSLASPVIVTGGNPQAGTTEADAMARWLIGHGVAAPRVHVESRASDTIGNARNSAQMMRALGLADAVVVTSANHMPRAVGDFVDAGVPVVGMVSPQHLPLQMIEDVLGPAF